MTGHVKLPVIPFIQPNGIEEYHISGIEDWDGFEAIAKFIGRRFSAEVTDKLDGICSRTWSLRIGEINFILKHHEDIGNFFFAAELTVEKQKLMQAIANALNTQLLCYSASQEAGMAKR